MQLHKETAEVLLKKDTEENNKVAIAQDYNPDQAWIGYVYMFLHVFQLCLQAVFSKILFNRHPNVNATQVLLVRSVFSLIVFMLLMNKKILYYMRDECPRDQIGNLINRVLHVVFGLLCIYTSVKYLPLVIVALVTNLAPLLTVVFSYIFLRVALNWFDSAILLVSFAGVVIIITGAVDHQSRYSNTQEEGETSLFIPIAMLILSPFILASNAIILRKLKNMSEITVGAYSALAIFFAYIPIVFFLGQDLEFIWDFDLFDWFLCICLGVVSSYVMICRMKANQYEEPAKLAFVSYFQSIIQFIFDVTLFDYTFTMQEIYGILVVFGTVSIKWIYGIYKVCLSRRNAINNKL